MRSIKDLDTSHHSEKLESKSFSRRNRGMVDLSGLLGFLKDDGGRRALRLLALAGVITTGGYVIKKTFFSPEVEPTKTTPEVVRNLRTTRSVGPEFTPQAQAALDQIATKKADFTFDPYDPERIRGKLSAQEVKDRTINYKNPNVTIVHGLCDFNYYVCTKEDEKFKDTEKIRAKLSKVKTPSLDLSYLQNDQYSEKIRGFNVGKYAIKAGEWLPIPANNRTLSDKELLYHANIAIDEVRALPRYQAGIDHMLNLIGRDELVGLMVATAKKECGPFPVGDCQSFRSERFKVDGKVKIIYSYGIYQILNDGHGKNALRHLNIAVSQTRNPVSSSKQYLAFMLEKSGAVKGNYEKLDSLLPGTPGWEDNYAKFYNGPKAKADYPRDILTYRQSIFNYFDGKEESSQPSAVRKSKPNTKSTLTNFESPLEPRIEELVGRYRDIYVDSPASMSALRPDEKSAWYVKVIKGPGIDKAKGEVIVDINGSKLVPAGSMNKVQVAIAYFTAVDQEIIAKTDKDIADIKSMLVASNNSATNRLMLKVGKALGATSAAKQVEACEQYLKEKYPGKFPHTQLQYIPTGPENAGRAYEMKITVKEFSNILEGLEKNEFPYSEVIMDIMDHPTKHNRLVNRTKIVSKMTDSASGKTGTLGIMIGDGQVIRLKTDSGQDLVYTMVAVINRPPKKAYQSKAATMNLQTRGNKVLRSASDLTAKHIAGTHDITLPEKTK